MRTDKSLFETPGLVAPLKQGGRPWCSVPLGCALLVCYVGTRTQRDRQMRVQVVTTAVACLVPEHAVTALLWEETWI